MLQARRNMEMWNIFRIYWSGFGLHASLQMALELRTFHALVTGRILLLIGMCSAYWGTGSINEFVPRRMKLLNTGQNLVEKLSTFLTLNHILSHVPQFITIHHCEVMKKNWGLLGSLLVTAAVSLCTLFDMCLVSIYKAIMGETHILFLPTRHHIWEKSLRVCAISTNCPWHGPANYHTLSLLSCLTWVTSPSFHNASSQNI